MNVYNFKSYNYIIEKLILLTRKNTTNNDFENKKIKVITKFLLELMQENQNFSAYIFDKLAFIYTHHYRFLSDESKENVIDLLLLFMDYEKTDVNTGVDKGNKITLGDIDFDKLKFLFYNNFASYHNLKYLIKSTLNEEGLKDLKDLKLAINKYLFICY